ncbi:Crp/Fnr family transcriptional regulator [Dyadobacter sp. CY312]|uniref:Crp/Fnr family transcriptional regulator n=1 Tax=Dyadobacter sp. CY312 TaxID=2907303 RepID=UPI001F2B40A3|nr:Crp/Fnr family transcriptional regulator [Dyadobacter sp. CY312]MCE7043273.1 Crp/Fnr family transcriptional regulator [Dyadobacter sp. CY312]
MDTEHQNIIHSLLQIQPNLQKETLEAFCNILRFKSYKKGETISLEGKTNNVVSFIESGAVMVYNHLDGRKKVYNFFFEHEFTGDYESFLTRKPAVYGIEAVEDTTLLNLHYNNLQKIYNTYPDFERIGRIMAETQFLRLVQRNTSLLAQTPEERYLNLIKTKPQVLQRVPQYYVASYLGITPEALSRIRKRLVKI